MLQNQREGARDTGSWGPLPGQRFTDLCLINTLIFFFLMLENILGLHVQLLNSDFEKAFSA